MRERNDHLTIRKIIYPFLLIAMVITCMAGTKPVFAAQAASDALDAAFAEDEEDTVSTANAGRFIFDDNNLDESQVATV